MFDIHFHVSMDSTSNIDIRDKSTSSKNSKNIYEGMLTEK